VDQGSRRWGAGKQQYRADRASGGERHGHDDRDVPGHRRADGDPAGKQHVPATRFLLAPGDARRGEDRPYAEQNRDEGADPPHGEPARVVQRHRFAEQGANSRVCSQRLQAAGGGRVGHDTGVGGGDQRRHARGHADDDQGAAADLPHRQIRRRPPRSGGQHHAGGGRRCRRGGHRVLSVP
jgi:hypothetical protein